jgi:hypothetical protein
MNMASLRRTISALRQYGRLKEDAGTLLACGFTYLFFIVASIYMILTQPDGARFVLFLVLAPMLAIGQAWSLITCSLMKLRESEMWTEYHRGREEYLLQVRDAIAADPNHMPEDLAMKGYDLQYRPFYT